MAESSTVVAVSEQKSLNAEELKQKGNTFFAQQKFLRALDLYSEAIELDATKAVYFSNRAFCHLKLENYGAAILDSNTAISLDPAYTKAYHRRGCALASLNKWREAERDFKMVVKRNPKDGDAAAKLKECTRRAFEEGFKRAIGTNAGKPPSEVVDLKSIDVEASYTGPRLDGPVTLEFVQELMEHFRTQKNLHRKYVYKIVMDMIKLLQKMPTLVDVEVPEGKEITVCGDVHGQYYDVLNIFKLNGMPGPENPYLFNGDFVDRGSFSLEIALVFFSLKLLYPSHFHVSRGNHETLGMNATYGFKGEVIAKCDVKAYELFEEAFNWLPLGYCLNKKVLVVHGGIFSEDGVKLDDIRSISRVQQPPEKGLMCELMWSDPQPQKGRAPSKRGVGLSFGPDVTANFLEANGLELLVRSHEVKEQGYAVDHDGKCITVFSAPNYCDTMGNKGAFIRFGADMKPQFSKFAAVPHPPVRAMAYAQPLFQ